jgi:hypothetical protein
MPLAGSKQVIQYSIKYINVYELTAVSFISISEISWFLINNYYLKPFTEKLV